MYINNIFALTGLFGIIPGFILIVSYPGFLANKIHFNESRNGKIVELFIILISICSIVLGIYCYINFK